MHETSSHSSLYKTLYYSLITHRRLRYSNLLSHQTTYSCKIYTFLFFRCFIISRFKNGKFAFFSLIIIKRGKKKVVSLNRYPSKDDLLTKFKPTRNDALRYSEGKSILEKFYLYSYHSPTLLLFS